LKIKSTSLLITCALFGAAVMPAYASNEAMMDLLKVLRDRGTITSQDYELLANAAKADKEADEAVAMKVEKVSTASKSLEWPERIKLKGDMRARYEDQDAVDSSNMPDDKRRFRIRARLGAYAQVNETTKAGIRLVTTVGSATSTNQTLENNFSSTDVGIDLGYIDWAPTALGGNTHFIFGKMKKPWESVSGMVWDGDTNPEGVAIKSKLNAGGVTLIPSVGYYTLDDNGTDSFSEDSHLGHAQLAAIMGKTRVGVSYFGFESANTDAMGNFTGPSEEERMFQLFGETAIPSTPVTVFANYVHNTNADASGDDDNAWSLGAKAKMGSFKLSYEYLDLGVNALNDNFDNSDFGNDSKGSIIKAAYKINNSFTAQATYYTSDTNINNDDTEADLLHLDLKVKF
jgi:hypothetical protein